MLKAGRHTSRETAQGARAGQYLPQPQGYRAFIPATLPPNPPVQVAGDLQRSDTSAKVVSPAGLEIVWQQVSNPGSPPNVQFP